MSHRPRQDSVCGTMEDDPQDWPPLTAFYHYAGPSSQSNAPSTTTNASPPPIAVTTTYIDGNTATTNHTTPVTILIFHTPIHPSFDKEEEEEEDDDDDDKNSNNKNNNNSDPPLDPSQRCVSCRKDFASTVVADDIATFPVLVGPHCDCTYHAGCLAQPYFDRATMLPVRRRNMACPACGGEGFGGREAEMGCWEDDDDDEWEKGAGGGDGEDEGGDDDDDDDDDIVQFEMPRSAVVTEGMVVIRFEPEWEEGPEVEVAEGAVSRRAVAFALIVKWASGDDGEGEKEGEEGMQAQQDGKMPGDSVLPGCEQQLASLTLDQPQQQQKIQEKTVASAEEKEDVGPA